MTAAVSTKLSRGDDQAEFDRADDGCPRRSPGPTDVYDVFRPTCCGSLESADGVRRSTFSDSSEALGPISPSTCNHRLLFF